uniref:Uncharacterized protein n=1 Tax=Aegilops tauschii subsp. strangulata TaxID=200361 RepID=A0A453L3B5_AEGTS
SAAAVGAEPDLVVGDVVHHRERLLLRVPEDADVRAVAVGRERQARLRHLGHVQHPAEVEPHGGAAGEHQRHRRYAHRRVPREVVARVQDGQRGRPLVPVPAHGARELRPERGVRARRQAGDHRPRVDHRAGGREHDGGDPDRPPGDLDADEADIVERRRVAAGLHRRESCVRRRRPAEGQVPRGAGRRREAVGEPRPVLGRRLGRQRHLLAAEPDEPVGPAEQAGVPFAAPEDEPRERVGRRQRQRVARQGAVGLRLVAVHDLVPAFPVRRAAPRVQPLALRRGAGHGGVRRGPRRVEERVLLLVAVRARRALHPRQVAAGVEHHRHAPGRGAEAHGHDVVAGAEGDAPLRRQGHALRATGSVRHGRRRRGDLAVYGVDPGLVVVEELGVGRRRAPSLQRRARAVPVHDVEGRRV